MFSSGIRSRLVLPRRLVLPSIRTFSTTPTRPSGHNKWSKIKQRKGVEDAKRSKIYGKAARDIIMAAKSGSSTNPEENSLLAVAIRRARDAGVPKENIESAVAKAERIKGHGQAMLFEAIVNGSTGIIIECRSDNSNRTVKNINHILSSHKARSAPVKFMFQQRGYVKVQIGDDMEALLDQVMNVYSIDFADWSEESGQRGIELVCRQEDLSKVTKMINEFAATSPLCEVLTSEVNWASLEPQDAPEEDENSHIESLIEALEEDDDVERVFTTLEPNRLIADC
ncbi:hypothetical protein HYDPIDRAFT_106118 [Hydnomerulius pinastri MD-312]|nr:hypothetical protein HYDPIDRAFT_106118 [Hydnomerulius pinastri MD-312]